MSYLLQKVAACLLTLALANRNIFKSDCRLFHYGEGISRPKYDKLVSKTIHEVFIDDPNTFESGIYLDCA